MLISSLFVLVFAIVCHCQETTDLLLYPIEQTPYMVYFNKKISEPIPLTIKGQSIQFDGKSFLDKLDNKQSFKKGEQINGHLVKIAPPLPMHPLFCVRKIDSMEGKIQIGFNLNKEYLSSQRSYQYKFQVNLYNFKGDFLENLEFTRTAEENDITLGTSTIPKTEEQQYKIENTFDPHDLLVVVIRIISNEETSPWSFHIVYPKGFIDSEIGGQSMANQQDWSLDKIVKQQSGFQSLSMLEDNQKDWQTNSFKFAMLNWFTRIAALSQSEYNADTYLSRIQIPKSKSKDGNGGAYSIKDVAQRTGAGFGLYYWNTDGYHFSKKFAETFVQDNEINNDLLKSFVAKCFDYGQLLDARTTKEKETVPETHYRNKAGNNNWEYTISSKKLTGERTMIGEQVSEISWMFDSKTWKTNADGIVQI